MPELPEVENINIGLQTIINSVVLQVYQSQFKLRYQSPLNLQCLLQRQIISISRRAKYLLIEFDGDLILVVHLGMTGNLLLQNNFVTQKHDHFACLLNLPSGNQQWLVFNDIRRFGFVSLFTKNQQFLPDLGPEPLNNEFDAKYLQQQLINKNITIKTAIMNNKIVVGVGNIYASESLFLAKISPLAIAKTLTFMQIENLVIAIKNILQKAINNGGSSISNYKNLNNKSGSFQLLHSVYNKKICPKCSAKINKITITGRSTYFCQNCQK